MTDNVTRRGALALLLGAAPALAAAQDVTHCACSDGTQIAIVRLGERELKRRQKCARRILAQLQEGD